MNRNLKRVLSLALTLAVMAVNFVIPAMASDSITVSYMDLLNYGSLLQKQGELYFETTPGNANANSGVDGNNSNLWLTQYLPLDVYKNNTGLNIKPTEWVRFEAVASVAGYYSVDMNAAIGAVNGTDAYIRTEKTIIEKHFTRTGTGQYSYTDINDIGYVYLDAGTNYIYVDNKGGSYINFRTLTLTLDATADVTMVKWLAPVQSANEFADYADSFSYADGYNQAAVGTVTFDMDIPVDGKYKVSVMGKADSEDDVSVSFGGDAKSATASNDTYAYTEIGVFGLTASEYTMTFNGFADYSLAWVKVEYVAPLQTDLVGESFADGDTVARGTDNLTLTYNDNMKDTATATLTVDGTEIPVAVDVEGANVVVSFLETLDFETEYLLEVTGLQGANDEEALADRTYTFTTDAEGNDAGADDVTVTDVSSVREDVTIEGIVKGSTGYGIKGRTVSVTKADGTEVATATTGENGAFVAEFVIDETVAGAYNYTVTSEYGATDTAVVRYISATEELNIIAQFESATTTDAVLALFASYAEVLQVENYVTDCDSLTDDTLFLAHFQGKEFTAVSEVTAFYNKMLAVEGMNQETRGGTYITNNYLKNQATLELMGINFEELKVIPENKLSDLGTKINQDNQSGASTSYEDFVARMQRIVKAFAMEVHEITGTSFVTTNATTSCFYAGEIAIPLDFAAAQTKVKTVIVTVVASDAALLTDAEAIVTGATTDVAISGNTATFTIDFEPYYAEKIYDNFGKISLKASRTGSFTFDVAGTVIYRAVNGDAAVDMEVVTTGGTVSTMVSATPADTIRPVETVGSTGGGGYTAPAKEKVEESEEDTTKSQYFFDDMGEALWAQDMVHTLVGKGIISKNDARKFRPMDNITREEYVKMLVTVVGSHNADARSNLADVSGDHWASSYIATAQQLGIVQGNADGSFGLGQQITRQDMAVMLYRTFKMLGIDLPEGSNEFADAYDIADYAKAAVSALEKQGIINGMGDGTFAPVSNATRAQSAKVIYSMMEVLGV